MRFEWDSAKAQSNAQKHGVPFPYAARVFLDAFRVTQHNKRLAQEPREVTLGMIEERLFVVVHTKRGSAIRIISARKGNRREQKKYYQLQVKH